MAQVLEKVNMSPKLRICFALKSVIIFKNSVFGKIQYSQVFDQWKIAIMKNVGFLFLVPTADVQYVLVCLQCYPAIPASKNTLVLAAWINFKVGTPIKQNKIFTNNLILVQTSSSTLFIPNTFKHLFHGYPKIIQSFQIFYKNRIQKYLIQITHTYISPQNSKIIRNTFHSSILHMTKSMCIAVQLSKVFFHNSQLQNERLLDKSQNPREIRTCSLPIARHTC